MHLLAIPTYNAAHITAPLASFHARPVLPSSSQESIMPPPPPPPKKKRRAEPTPSAGSGSPAGAPDAAVTRTAIVVEVSTGTRASARSSVEAEEEPTAGTSSGISFDRATVAAFLAEQRAAQGDPAGQQSEVVMLKQQVAELKQKLKQKDVEKDRELRQKLKQKDVEKDRELKQKLKEKEAQKDRELKQKLKQKDRELKHIAWELAVVKSTNRILAGVSLVAQQDDAEDPLANLESMVAAPSEDQTEDRKTEDQRKSENFTAKLLLYLLLLFSDVARSMPLKKIRRAKKGK